ncbi:glycoside hydrolase [Sphingobacteriaceae bacterium]|nr:glycoside hydrolase [Sphingobacteriaceae bacterium]
MNFIFRNGFYFFLLAFCLQSYICPANSKTKVFNVLNFGARGDGTTLDTKAFQQAIDKASAAKGQVVVPGGYKFLVGSIILKSNMDFHLEEGSVILISTEHKDYIGEAAIKARNADNLTISGTGYINGQDLKYMDHYEKENEWWIPKEWRPNLFELIACKNLLIKDISFGEAPRWGLHMIGCEKVLIDHITIKNHLDVPNCDGIDPDHCRDVEIKNCNIECGDDGIVIKATKQDEDFGPSANIRVHDCIIKTQDSGIKIGTETTSDVYNVTFERIKILASCRGITIQLRDAGNVHHIVFSDITFESKYHSDPWWGRGEAISFTAIPRTPETKLGMIHDITVKNVSGNAENSARISGTKESVIKNVLFENVHITFARTTLYKGGLFDNRPTKVYEGIEQHSTPAYSIRFAEEITLKNCSAKWGKNVPDYFSYGLETNDVKNIHLIGFDSQSAHPEIFDAVFFR